MQSKHSYLYWLGRSLRSMDRFARTAQKQMDAADGESPGWNELVRTQIKLLGKRLFWLYLASFGPIRHIWRGKR